MTSPGKEKMELLVQKMASEPDLSPGQRGCVNRLAQLNWATDLVALARLWRSHPEWVESYLDLLVCELHGFPESHLGRHRRVARARPLLH